MFKRVTLPLKTALAAAALLVAAAQVPTAANAADTYKIDPGHVYAGFKIMHLGYSNMFGRFNKVGGSFKFDGKTVTGAAVDVSIDTGSIDTNHEKRDAHLASPDFFNALEFPTLTFVSTSVTSTGAKTAKMTGDLTLLGVTKSVTLDVTFNKAAVHPFDGKKPADQQRFVAGFSASGTIKRSDFGMKYGVPMLGDEVTLMVEAEGIRQ